MLIFKLQLGELLCVQVLKELGIISLQKNIYNKSSLPQNVLSHFSRLLLHYCWLFRWKFTDYRVALIDWLIMMVCGKAKGKWYFFIILLSMKHFFLDFLCRLSLKPNFSCLQQYCPWFSNISSFIFLTIPAWYNKLKLVIFSEQTTSGDANITKEIHFESFHFWALLN